MSEIWVNFPRLGYSSAPLPSVNHGGKEFFPNELSTEGNNFSKMANFQQKQSNPVCEYLGIIIFEKNP